MIQALVYGNGGQESERAVMVLEACGQDVREFLLGVDFSDKQFRAEFGKEAEYPQIALSIVPSNRLIDLRRDGVDIGVRYGDGNWPGLEATPLVAADYTVVAAPGVVRTDQISQADVPWYFEENHAEAQRWAMATGMIAHDRNIHSVATLGMALSAVRSGSGVTVTSSALVADDIKAGRLIALRQTHPEKMGYYIIHYPGVMSERAKTFKSWLLKAI